MMLQRRTGLIALLLTCGFLPSAIAGEPLLVVGKPVEVAEFAGVTATGVLEFRVGDATRDVHLVDLVRWSTPRVKLDGREIWLIDGTRFVLADSWTGKPSWKLVGDRVSITTQLFGEISVSLQEVRAIVLRAPTDLRQRLQFVDRLLDTDGSDSLQLIGGDRFLGSFIGCDDDKAGRQIRFALASATDPLRVPADRVAAISFDRANEPATAGKLLVGTRDGSSVVVDSLSVEADNVRLRLPNGAELPGFGTGEVVSLRSLISQCEYLSDLQASSYRHVPYLKIQWPYARDRNALSGPLQVGGRTYDKGLGMPTAARLTYQLDATEMADKFTSFAATVAVDDAADRRGSVAFRVYLERDDQWREAYTSPIVRGGDPPLPVRVELGDARQLALVTDFADRGDERDYANWLDARLE